MAATPISAVTVRMRRPLDAEETALVTELLEVAESRVRLRVGDERLAEWLAGADYAQSFRGVIADAVARVLRNPEGYRQESVGPFSWTYDVSVASGMLELTEEDWEALLDPEGSAGGGAFSVDTALSMPAVPWAVPNPLRAFNPLVSPGWWGDLS